MVQTHRPPAVQLQTLQPSSAGLLAPGTHAQRLCVQLQVWLSSQVHVLQSPSDVTLLPTSVQTPPSATGTGTVGSQPDVTATTRPKTKTAHVRSISSSFLPKTLGL